MFFWHLINMTHVPEAHMKLGGEGGVASWGLCHHKTLEALPPTSTIIHLHDTQGSVPSEAVAFLTTAMQAPWTWREMGSCHQQIFTNDFQPPLFAFQQLKQAELLDSCIPHAYFPSAIVDLQEMHLHA